MSFNFGSSVPPTTTAAGSGFTFGATTTATFGTPQAGAQTGAPVFGASVPSFGATPQTSAPAFGATDQTIAPAFGFTPQTSAPAFGSVTSAPAFGATPQTSAPIFGAATSAPAFGATTSAPAFGVAPQTTPAFGAAPQTSALSFGVTPHTSAPAFGSTPKNSALTLSGFVTTTTTSSTQPPSFGSTSFGASAATTTTASSFGFTSTTVPTTQPPAFGGFGLATTSQPAVPTFGSTTTTAAATGLNFTGLSKPVTATFGSTTSGPTLPSFGLGTSTATTNPTSNISFAPTVTAATSLGGGSLFGLKTTPGLTFNTTTASITFGSSLGTSTTTTQSATKPGLGGSDVNATQPKTVEGRSESVRAKDSQVPQEIMASVEMLKSHIKQQKTISSDIARSSTRRLFNISKELQNCILKLSEMSNCVENNYAAIKFLRSETAGAIRQAEMAQRTHETPAGLQLENNAPLQFFIELVQKFESDLILFRNKVTLTEKHIQSLTNPQGFTAEDLKKGLQQMYESFVALAGRVHETHINVEALKEQYLKLRKFRLKDSSNVFEEQHTSNDDNKLLSMGPTPFSTLAELNLVNNVSTQASWSQTQQNQENVFGQSHFGNQTSLFGTGNTFGSLNSTDGGFSLQKPPVGLKRNKH